MTSIILIEYTASSTVVKMEALYFVKIMEAYDHGKTFCAVSIEYYRLLCLIAAPITSVRRKMDAAVHPVQQFT